MNQIDTESIRCDPLVYCNGTYKNRIDDTKNKEKYMSNLRAKESCITHKTRGSFAIIDIAMCKTRCQTLMGSKVVSYLGFGGWISICLLGNVVTAILLYKNSFAVEGTQKDNNIRNNISSQLQQNQNDFLDAKPAKNQSQILERGALTEVQNEILEQNRPSSNSTDNGVSNYSM